MHYHQACLTTEVKILRRKNDIQITWVTCFFLQLHLPSISDFVLIFSAHNNTSSILAFFLTNTFYIVLEKKGENLITVMQIIIILMIRNS